MPDSQEATFQMLDTTHENDQKKNNEKQLTEMGAMNRFFKQRQRCSFERDHIVHSDSLLAPVARHQHYFALFAVLTATERLQGSIGIAPHSAVLGNLDLVVTIERGNVSLFGDISNLNRCESILKFLRFGQQSSENHCHSVDASQFPKTIKIPPKRKLITRVLEWNLWTK